MSKLGLSRLERLEPAAPVVRYERAAPGELLHLDTKKLGRIVGLGHRVTGQRQHRNRGIGWDMVHLAIDRVMTDNGTGYRSKAFRAACAELVGVVRAPLQLASTT